jgi:hypothetical protein
MLIIDGEGEYGRLADAVGAVSCGPIGTKINPLMRAHWTATEAGPVR